MMNSAADLLLHRSHHYLVSLKYVVEASLTGEHGEATPEHALALGQVQYDMLNQLLKACLDADDLSTFREVEGEWAEMFDDVWLDQFPHGEFERTWSDLRGGPARPEALQLLRQREVLRFGLAMWITHLLKREQDPSRRDRLGEALRLLAHRFASVEWVIDAYSEAQEYANAPWTDWFLSELPSGQAHIIPTDDMLLFALVVLLTQLLGDDEPAPLPPRDWLVWRQEDIERHLETLRTDPERWQPVLGVSPVPMVDAEEAAQDPWLRRIDTAADLFRRAVETQRETERAQVRELRPDSERVEQVRGALLRETRESRVVRDTFRVQGGLELESKPPTDTTVLVSRYWVPKSFFVPGSRVIGLDRMGRDLARSAARAEQQQLLAALPEHTPEAGVEDIAAGLRARLRAMRASGLRPSLILVPVNWRLERELAIAHFGEDISEHPLVPLVHRREFSGLFDDVPVLRLVDAPDDRVFVLDLVEAARFTEWESEDESGIRFELLSFDAGEAAAFVARNPEVKGERDDPEAIADLQEKVLITVSLCWKITTRNTAAVEVLLTPDHLRRDEGS